MFAPNEMRYWLTSINAIISLSLQWETPHIADVTLCQLAWRNTPSRYGTAVPTTRQRPTEVIQLRGIGLLEPHQGTVRLLLDIAICHNCKQQPTKARTVKRSSDRTHEPDIVH